MANAIYEKYKNALMTAAANVSLDQNDATNGPYAMLKDEAGTPHVPPSPMQFLNEVEANKVGTESRIQVPTVGTVGQAVFDGADVTFTAVVGATAEALIIFRSNSGASSTKRLVAFIDGVTGMPVTPNGGDIIVTWNASGIFKL